MGDIESVRVDVQALLDVAGRYDAVADAVAGLTEAHLARLTFDGAHAGRDHVARGDAVRRAVDQIVDQTVAWSRAMREIGSALRVSVDRYLDADARNTARLG